MKVVLSVKLFSEQQLRKCETNWGCALRLVETFWVVETFH